ncbi:MAG TPA: hypothetical protein VFO11_05840 [Candidatus Polarisedimenticolaceae bacterium]|nr:hypothetical protein [Candidatus Polarisedimenticolaceae bacterium]
MRVRILVVAVLMFVGCGGGSSSGDPTEAAVSAQFTPSGTASAPNLVRMTQAVVDRDLVRINVVLGGQTSSTDIYSFAFDLVLSDATVASYVAGSAQAGTALQPTGGQSIAVFANPDSARPNRVVVGVSKVGGGAGNGVSVGEAIVVSLVFRVLRRDVTSISFGGSSSNPTSPNFKPVALNSQNAVIASIDFDPAPVRLTGS